VQRACHVRGAGDRAWDPPGPELCHRRGPDPGWV